MPKYHDTENIIINDDEIYEELFESRGVNSIRHYRTKKFRDIKTQNIRVYKYVWTYGDTLRKLSFKYYNSADYWWVIGMTNGKPTDAHYKLGDEISIPVSPSELREE